MHAAAPTFEPLDGAAATVTRSAAGARTRSNANPSGRGANNATAPATQPAHSRTVATIAGACDQSDNASARIVPTVSGSATHATRAHHVQITHAPLLRDS